MRRLTCFEACNSPVGLEQELTNHVACICCFGRGSAQQRIADISLLMKGYA